MSSEAAFIYFGLLVINSFEGNILYIQRHLDHAGKGLLWYNILVMDSGGTEDDG